MGFAREREYTLTNGFANESKMIYYTVYICIQMCVSLHIIVSEKARNYKFWVVFLINNNDCVDIVVYNNTLGWNHLIVFFSFIFVAFILLDSFA